jgi:hypothetical protein
VDTSNGQTPVDMRSIHKFRTMSGKCQSDAIELRCIGWDGARYNARMFTPQAGIFALGTSSHAYLEFDLLDAKKCKEFASTISAIREPRTTTGGVNFVIGFRPELWRNIVPEDAPASVEGFNKEIQGTEGFVMPATQT